MRDLDGGLRARADHADDRDLEHLARVVERSGRGRIASDDDELDIAAFEVPDDVDGEAANLILEAGPVWEMQQIGDVDRRFRGQPLADRPQHGEPTHT